MILALLEPLLLTAAVVLCVYLLGPLRGLLLAGAYLLLVWAAPALALPPSPDPHPAAAPGRVRWEPYVYVTKDRRDGAPVVCFVPVVGKRLCVRFP